VFYFSLGWILTTIKVICYFSSFTGGGGTPPVPFRTIFYAQADILVEPGPYCELDV
jgi:hypothetical protein